jgi:hypothetical protein
MELKAKFDEGNVTAQQYINNVLIPAVVADDLTEQTRAAAEAERVANEIERVASETNRLSAENARVSAEANRIAAESAREQAEQARVDSTTGIVARAHSYAVSASNSAESASSSAAEATRQAGIASAYATSAEQVANNVYAAASGADNSRAEARESAVQAGAYALNAARSEAEAKRYAEQASSSGAGDMLQSVYDTTGKRTDIFKYVDNKISAIPTPDLSKTLSFEDNALFQNGADVTEAVKDALGGGGAKIVVGTYTGAGGVGTNSPNVVNLGFKPKIFMFPSMCPVLGAASPQNCAIFYAGADSVNTTIFNAVYEGATNYNFPLHIDFVGNGIRWYCYGNYAGVSPTAYTQMNESGRVYPYIAIG